MILNDLIFKINHVRKCNVCLTYSLNFLNKISVVLKISIKPLKVNLFKLHNELCTTDSLYFVIFGSIFRMVID